jgi:hypothetical protein
MLQIQTDNEIVKQLWGKGGLIQTKPSFPHQFMQFALQNFPSFSSTVRLQLHAIQLEIVPADHFNPTKYCHATMGFHCALGFQASCFVYTCRVTSLPPATSTVEVTIKRKAPSICITSVSWPARGRW